MLLQDTLSNSARATPHAVAVFSNGQRVTYAELDELSNRIARLLVAAGCEPGDRVGLLVPKSIPAIAGMLGVLKAGAIYVPMDSASPATRLARIIDVCGPRFIFACSASSNLLAALSQNAGAGTLQIGWLESAASSKTPSTVAFSWDDLNTVPSAPVAVRRSSDDAAHILFTSGSTGVPKGVVITHANVLHFINWATRYFHTAPSDRISCHPPLHFDLSTFDIYGTLLAGAELYLVPPETSLLPHYVADYIRRSELTQWFSVPSVLKYLAQFDVVKNGDFPSLKRVLWCGEALPTPTLIYWMKRLPHVTFTNLYGPTETTIASSYYTVPSCPSSDTAEIPIGQACEGEELLVLDESLRQARTEEIGELYIRGAGLSPGYWRDSEKTSSVFLVNGDGSRMYKTGDLAKVGDDGLVYLLGRADSQIKSRGYRIELGEIEAALYGIAELRECAVVALPEDGFEGTIICCAYVHHPERYVSSAEVRARLAQLLPAYMLPSRWIALDALPLNANGKVDRPRLRQQFQTAVAAT